MSEVKGSLLAIVLAVSVFGVVFGIINLAMKNSADSISQRIKDTAEIEPDVTGQTSLAYTFHN